MLPQKKLPQIKYKILVSIELVHFLCFLVNVKFLNFEKPSVCSIRRLFCFYLCENTVFKCKKCLVILN